MPAVLAAAAAMVSVQSIDVRIDLAETRPKIEPYIYGQFIEHLGRCIYGGIWAEMLEDRKFYFPVTKEFNPYRDRLDTAFPEIGASPWQILHGSVTMETANPFVGKHTPVLAAGTSIQQSKLGTVAGKKYVGYAWLRRTSLDPDVTVRFQGESASFRPGDAYTKFSFAFTADQTTEDASLEISAKGGAVALGTLSLMPADNVKGMRRDTLAKLKDLGGTIYRWPGGNFVSGYDWRDGIGDRDRRAPKTNPAWAGLEHNDFGTDEFITFCREIGADPLVTVNTGFGDAYSAAQWVEYCNAPSNTIGGSWRAKYGHKQPYGVKTWCVGNEMWGQWQLGYMNIDHYAFKHKVVSEAMLKVDPGLTLIGSGDLGDPFRTDAQGRPNGNSWSRGMLERVGTGMDLISEHLYDGRLPWTNNQRFPLAQAVTQMRNGIRAKAEGHRKLQPMIKSLGGKTVPIAMDEWNYWHRGYPYGDLGCEYDLADGLGVAAGLHEFFRQTDMIKIATYAQTVNVIGAIKTNRTAAELESTGLVLQLYRHKFGSVPVKIQASDAPLDLVAALSADGKSVTIGFVNPTESPIVIHLDQAVLDAGKAAIAFVTGKSETAHNTPGQSRQVDIHTGSGTVAPPLSCGVITVPVRKV